ncbi:hypothetical protein [Pantoea sp. AS-PWVM4]|uniref:hypothetical protein n=1 Tax=Pantoea sp. AS-PWVM4 TaxID=1332069 RepID=UPI00056B56BA|nr:hypothetical protein [Pantoea sp. AS-PWVM4]
MKHTPLKDVMQQLQIVIVDGGFELHNAAGTAFYDSWGCRGEVHGIPEYFPVLLSVSGPINPVSEESKDTTKCNSLYRAVNDLITEKIKNEIRPGGLLHKQ